MRVTTVNDREAARRGSPARGRPHRPRLTRLAAIASLCAGASLLVAACGTGADSPGIASIGSRTTTTQATAPNGAGGGSLSNDELKYAQCMRAHGVPSFPDPTASGGFTLPEGVNPASPAMRKAQATCQRLLPGGGFPAPGAQTHPSAAALASMLKVTQCMRRHGIDDFPEPTTSMPKAMPSGGVVSDRDGVILVFPPGLDTSSPQFAKAAAACQFALTNH